MELENLRLGFLASHGGSNFQAIVNNILEKKLYADARVLISNNSSAKVLERARIEGVPSFCFNSKNFGKFPSEEIAIIQTMKEFNVNLIILAGYMKKIGKGILEKYHNRILNIHPAIDLIKYGGKGNRKKERPWICIY